MFRQEPSPTTISFIYKLNKTFFFQIMRKMLEKGEDFISSESSRVENLLKSKISQDKQTEMQQRINILQSFTSHDEL